MPPREAHVERLIGCRVHDSSGRAIGRIEELIVGVVDGADVVTEFHIGPVALLERIAGFMTQLPLLELLPYARRGYRAPWQLVDLSDPTHPRVRARVDELERLDLDAPS